VLEVLDPWLYRHPFEGRSAVRYARDERPAFGDLDARLCERWASDLGRARVVLDVGAGPGTFAAAVRARWPQATVIAADPSHAFAAMLARDGGAVCARGEALPLRDGAVDVAVMISAIRHVADRRATFAELRRVVRPGGAVLLVELDPAAEATRVRRHARKLHGPLLRAAFGPLVVRTAPTGDTIAARAREAGWSAVERDDDELQPVYRMRIT
jgi:ubiquinone/menaquinone biosynthesis C-methylase UbiE